MFKLPLVIGVVDSRLADVEGLRLVGALPPPLGRPLRCFLLSIKGDASTKKKVLTYDIAYRNSEREGGRMCHFDKTETKTHGVDYKVRYSTEIWHISNLSLFNNKKLPKNEVQIVG